MPRSPWRRPYLGTAWAEDPGIFWIDLRTGETRRYLDAGDLFRSQEAAAPREPIAVTADIDNDGVPETIVGQNGKRGGAAAIYRGAGDASDRHYVVQAFRVPEPLDLIGIGDFNRDGHEDLVLIANGGRSYRLQGDGQGGLSIADEVAPKARRALSLGGMWRGTTRQGKNLDFGVGGKNVTMLEVSYEIQGPGCTAETTTTFFRLRVPIVDNRFTLRDDFFDDIMVKGRFLSARKAEGKLDGVRHRRLPWRYPHRMAGQEG